MTRGHSAKDACRLRLASQFLVRPLRGSPAELVRTLGAVQAQDYPGAKWAVAQRLVGGSDAVVEAEVAAGSIVRTHVLRPTWHFVAADDLRWMLALTAPRIAGAMAWYNRALGLTGAVFRRSTDAIARALEGGRHLIRPELRTVIERAGITASGQRLARLVMQAELDAVICSGPRRGSQFTYALVDERVPPTRPRDRDEALGELARRYFATRGPATAHDFAWWSGLSVGDARRAAAVAGSTLAQVTMGGHTRWYDPAQRAVRLRRSVAHLLPNYDEYFIGYRDRSAIAERAGSVALVTGGDARITHVALIDGQLVGGWKRAQDSRYVTVTLQPVTPLSAAERDLLATEAERLARFLELSPVIRFTRALPSKRRRT